MSETYGRRVLTAFQPAPSAQGLRQDSPLRPLGEPRPVRASARVPASALASSALGGGAAAAGPDRGHRPGPAADVSQMRQRPPRMPGTCQGAYAGHGRAGCRGSAVPQLIRRLRSNVDRRHVVTVAPSPPRRVATLLWPAVQERPCSRRVRGAPEPPRSDDAISAFFVVPKARDRDTACFHPAGDDSIPSNWALSVFETP